MVAEEIPEYCRVGASTSQSVHTSEEGPVMGPEPRDAGWWMNREMKNLDDTGASAARLRKPESTRAA